MSSEIFTQYVKCLASEHLSGRGGNTSPDLSKLYIKLILEKKKKKKKKKKKLAEKIMEI